PPTATMTPPGGGGGGGGGYQNPLAGSGFARIGMPLFAIHAVTQELQSLSKAWDDVARSEMTADQAADHLAASLARGVPIVGGLVEVVGRYQDVLSGLATAQAANARFEQIQSERLQLT